MASTLVHHAKASHKFRKVGRNKRVRNNGIDGKKAIKTELSNYRLRHAIPSGSRKDNHAMDVCGYHRARRISVIRTVPQQEG